MAGQVSSSQRAHPLPTPPPQTPGHPDDQRSHSPPPLPPAQVFISYGTEQTNDSLLQYYGFVEPDCPKDQYVLTRALQWLPAHVPPAQLEPRLRQLEQANLKQALEKVSF